jgi:hypothetical protein
MENALKKMKILNNGYYSLFENDYGRRILVLDGMEWYVWIYAELGPTLIYSEPIAVHSSDYRIIMQGRYFLENLEDDILMPHLFLQDDDVYMELVLPQGLPSRIDANKSMIVTDLVYPKDYVENLNESVIPANQEFERTSFGMKER